MNFQTFTWLSFFHLLSLLLQSSYGFSHPEEYYHTCGTTFSCGSITDIGYPFRGRDDPLYCGHPSFVLTCDDQNNLTTIDIKNTTYRVLDIYRTTQTMKIVREDVMGLGGACPQEMVNTTLDYRIFDYSASYTNFTFLYGCPALNLSGLSLISCGYNDVYVLSGTQGPGDCNTSVVVPVLLTGNRDGWFMNSTKLSQVLQQGFEIRWKIGNQGCSDCVVSKGRCGYSFETGRTACFCPDPPYISDTCVMANGSSSSPGLVLVQIPSCVCQNDHYQTCNQPFQCGRLSDIRYPFYGDIRPISCGYPGFELDCKGEDGPRINISSITYRVLKIDNSTQTLQVSRNDLWSTLCPGSFSNTTLNFTLFDFYQPANDQNITLYYGCPLLSLSANYMFNCSEFNFNGNIFNFFATVEQSLQLSIGNLCNSLIYLPVNQNAYQELGSSTFASTVRLQSSIESGFTIQYLADNRCDNCKMSGGVCGYNETTTSFACRCRNGTSESTCYDLETGTGNGNGTSGNGMHEWLSFNVFFKILSFAVLRNYLLGGL